MSSHLQGERNRFLQKWLRLRCRSFVELAGIITDLIICVGTSSPLAVGLPTVKLFTVYVSSTVAGKKKNKNTCCFPPSSPPSSPAGRFLWEEKSVWFSFRILSKLLGYHHDNWVKTCGGQDLVSKKEMTPKFHTTPQMLRCTSWPNSRYLFI